MKKTMVYLHEDVHEGLRALAFEHKTSTAALIRRAVEFVYGEILEDIRDARAALAEYESDPSSAVSLDELLKEIDAEVPRRIRATRSKRAATASHS